MTSAVTPTLPYKIAVLCYLYDDAGHVLMLHRRKAPNAHLARRQNPPDPRCNRDG